MARSYNLEIFDVQFRREPIGWMLRVFVDVPFDPDAPWPDEAERRSRADASPTIQDLEHVSRDLSAVLDVEETIDHSYTLEVSSPGLDRPLRAGSDYRRFAGRLAKIVVSKPVDRQTHFEGRLGGFEDGSIVIETTPGKRQLIPLALVSVGYQLRLSAVRGKATALATGLLFKLALAPTLILILFAGIFGAEG